MRKSPCYENKPCPKRKPGCHSHCKDYKDWRLELDNHNKLVRKKREEERRLKEAELSRLTKISKLRG